MKMKIASFREWQKQKIQMTNAQEKVLCPECGGEGFVCVTCDYCSNEKEEECTLCEGSKEIVFGKLSFSEKQKCFTPGDYKKEVKRDLLDLANWTGKSFSHVCANFGFSVYSRLSDRKEIINIRVTV